MGGDRSFYVPLSRSLHWGPDPGCGWDGGGGSEKTGMEHLGDWHLCCTGKARVLFLHDLCEFGVVLGGPGGDMGEMVVAVRVVLPLLVTMDNEVPQTITDPCNVSGMGQV